MYIHVYMRICNIYIYMRIHIYNKSYSNNHRIIIYIYMYRGVQYCYFLLEFNIYNRNIIFIFICIHTQLIRLSALALATLRRANLFFLFVCPLSLHTRFRIIISGPLMAFSIAALQYFAEKKSCVFLCSRKASSNSFEIFRKNGLYISPEHTISIFSTAIVLLLSYKTFIIVWPLLDREARVA